MRLITTLDAADVVRIAERVAEITYDHNLVITATLERVRRDGRNLVHVRLSAADSRRTGARRSGSGRRGRWSCWHVFRDVMASWLVVDPDAIIRTGVATYRGAEHFLATHEVTGERNVGSVIQPAIIADLCDCEKDYGRDDVRRDDYVDYITDLETTLRTLGRA